ncbi:MAG: hypothetical protein [Bacteriophage sp.]|nr:MAG: hypothetical protein [Bacteriophage sp.]
MRPYIYKAEQFYSDRQQIPANCSGIMFINTGSVTAYINNMPLLAGATLVLDDQNENIDKTIYSYNFGGTTGGSITVWRKIYQ